MHVAPCPYDTGTVEGRAGCAVIRWRIETVEGWRVEIVETVETVEGWRVETVEWRVEMVERRVDPMEG